MLAKTPICLWELWNACKHGHEKYLPIWPHQGAENDVTGLIPKTKSGNSRTEGWERPIRLGMSPITSGQQNTTYPARFALIFEGLLRVLRGGLNIVHGVLHMILYAVYHFTLYAMVSTQEGREEGRKCGRKRWSGRSREKLSEKSDKLWKKREKHGNLREKREIIFRKKMGICANL